MTHSADPRHGPERQQRNAKPALVVKLMINLAAPVLAFILLRPVLHSDVAALVAGAAIPAAYTIALLLWRRKLDAIGAFAIVCFAIGLLLVLVTGGNELVFKLREDLVTGPLGLACIVSVALRRPLLAVALHVAARRNARIRARTDDPQARRITTVTTGVIGVILVVHAIVMVALALTTGTTIFLALSRPISLAMVGGGLTALVWWIRHQHSKPSGRPPATRLAGEGTVRASAKEKEGSPCPPSASREPTSRASRSARRFATGWMTATRYFLASG
jgi:hypothetical protein